MMLMIPGIYTGYVVGLAWISNTLPRPPAKRAAALAAINAVSNSSSIWVSYVYYDAAAPRYLAAMCLNAGVMLVVILTATVLRIFLKSLNKKLDNGEDIDELGSLGKANLAELEGLPSAEARQGGFRFLV